MANPNPSLEDSLNSAWENTSRSCAECYEQCEEKIRQAPIASVLFATAAGYLLNFLPIYGLFAGLVRVVLVLLKPAIFIFGAVKIVEYVRSQAAAAGPVFRDDAERDPVIDSPVGPNS